MNRTILRVTRFFSAFAVVVTVGTVLCLCSDTIFAQTTGGQPLYPAWRPTGSVADAARLSGVASDYFQPIRINVPEGINVAVAQPGGFLPVKSQLNPVGFLPGHNYRLRFSEIPLNADRQLYPSLEVIDRLYPPPGKEYQFPVVIDITREDIELALNGNLVTRVIYLENPVNAIPVDSTREAGKVSLDVRDGIDPVAVAGSRGAVMAIFRIGSRLPMEPPNSYSSFYFNLPPVTYENPTGK